jgi:putative molybdopterin biosynthesis protein
VLTAARALGLDFIPVAKERYDFAILQAFYDMPLLRALIGIIRDDKEFREQIVAMGGYDVSDMGNVIDIL